MLPSGFSLTAISLLQRPSIEIIIVSHIAWLKKKIQSWNDKKDIFRNP